MGQKSEKIRQETTFYDNLFKHTQKHLKPSDIVLDYTCGTGTISNSIAAHVREIHAVDISGKMIEAAKRKAASSNNGNITFTQSTILDEIIKKSFNVVVAINTSPSHKKRKSNHAKNIRIIEAWGTIYILNSLQTG